ncbi:MAG: PAS domain S-box protein, partial [Candidatus Binatia bacterium]
YLFEIGMRSAVTEALLANGALQGVLILAAAQPQAFTMAHRDILSEIANQLAVAMQTARLREQLQGYIRGLEQEVAERERAQEALQASEARYRDLIENASDIIYTHDLNGDFLSLNAAGEHLIGYFREEVRGLNIAHVVAADHLETARAAMAQQLRGEAPQLHEVELVTKAGRQLPVELSTRLIYEGSTAVGVQGIARDVTARKQAEEALAFKTAVLETQQETSPDGILVVGEHGSLISFNERFRAMWDIPPAIMALRDDEQALQSVLDKVVDPEGFLARVRFLAANREQTSHEEIHLCDGRVLDRYSAPMFGTDGKYYGRVWYVRDVTDRVRAQAAISELNAELEQRVRERTAQLEAANQELQAFSYSVSHDLRAPLRHIEGFSQALREEHGAQLDAEARDYLDRIQLAVRRMGQLIRDLLSLSQVTLRDMAPEVVQLGTLALEIGSALESEALQRQVEFVVAPDLAARGDARLLRIALENLLGNAWKYTSRQPTARIEFGATEHGDGVAYFVRDNGTGFDMEHAKKLFQPFERLHRSEQFEGTGIGLAIVQRIIHRHGGHIWAESAPGQGATFYFTLDGSAASSALRAG